MSLVRRRTADIVIEKIIKDYLHTDMEQAEKLPSERELAKRYEVSRNSVREALQNLALKGIIEIRQGGGSFVKRSEIRILDDVLSENNEEKSRSVFEMLEVRRALEIESAGLAAQRALAEDLDQIKEALEDMANAETAEAGIRADVKFHLCIVKASRNSILIQLSETIIGKLEETIRTTRQHRFSKETRYQETFNEHKEIYLAIASGDVSDAKRLIEEHITRVKRELSESSLPEYRK